MSLEFSLNLKCSETDGVTSDGRLFQVLATATGNARRESHGTIEVATQGSPWSL